MKQRRALGLIDRSISHQPQSIIVGGNSESWEFGRRIRARIGVFDTILDAISIRHRIIFRA